MAYSYLALGDSYTIGEAVRLENNFPYQTVQLLRKNNIEVCASEILATTGWTTDELNTAIDNTLLLAKYDIVSLLIGVNNQYRGRSVENYITEFESLVKRAIDFSGNKESNVFVLSIPDWGVTPFAKGRDIEKIAAEIDAYNTAAKKVCEKNVVGFIDITTGQRRDKDLEEFVAGDGLHPSGKEYGKWAALLTTLITDQIKQHAV